LPRVFFAQEALGRKLNAKVKAATPEGCAKRKDEHATNNLIAFLANKGESTVSYIGEKLDLTDKSMNDTRVFMMMLFLIVGHMVFTFYNGDCEHDKTYNLKIYLFHLINMHMYIFSLNL